jgi:hypothetical protein
MGLKVIRETFLSNSETTLEHDGIRCYLGVVTADPSVYVLQSFTKLDGTGACSGV